MRIPSISPLIYIGIGVGYSILNLFTEGSFDPFILSFFILASIIEVFARKQEKVPSIVISFFVSLALMLFVNTNLIDFKNLSNSSLEPLIQKGAVVFYQPNFYNINTNDLVIVKEYNGSNNLLCKVIEIWNQSYNVEIISQKNQIEISKGDLVGKVFYIGNNEFK